MEGVGFLRLGTILPIMTEFGFAFVPFDQGISRIDPLGVNPAFVAFWGAEFRKPSTGWIISGSLATALLCGLCGAGAQAVRDEIPYVAQVQRGHGQDWADFSLTACIESPSRFLAAPPPREVRQIRYPFYPGIVHYQAVDAQRECRTDEHPEGAFEGITFVHDSNPGTSPGFTP